MIFEIKGNCPSKKNNYKQSRGHWYKPEDIVLFEKNAFLQLNVQKKKYPESSFPLKGDLSIYLIIDIMKRDKDIDNLCTTIFDILEKGGIIENDKYITRLEAIKGRKQSRDLIQICISTNKEENGLSTKTISSKKKIS